MAPSPLTPEQEAAFIAQNQKDWARIMELAEQFRPYMLPRALWQPVGSQVHDWRTSGAFNRALKDYQERHPEFSLKVQPRWQRGRLAKVEADPKPTPKKERVVISRYTTTTWIITDPESHAYDHLDDAILLPNEIEPESIEPEPELDMEIETEAVEATKPRRIMSKYTPHYHYDNEAIIQWMKEHPDARGKEISRQFGCSQTRVSQIRKDAGFAPRKRGPLEGTPSPKKGWRTMRLTPAEQCKNGCGKPGALYSEYCSGEFCSKQCARDFARNTPGRKERIKATWKNQYGSAAEHRSDTTSGAEPVTQIALSSSDDAHSTTAPESSGDRSMGSDPLED